MKVQKSQNFRDATSFNLHRALMRSTNEAHSSMEALNRDQANFSFLIL